MVWFLGGLHTTQMLFLISLGIENFLQNTEGENRLKLLNKIKQLIMPEHMRESFKVISFGTKKLTLSGFNEQNFIDKL